MRSDERNPPSSLGLLSVPEQGIAFLASVAEAEFRVLGDELVLSDSDLSKQLKLLESAGYVAARKTTVDKYRKTWLSLSSAGRVAFDSHARALNELVVGSSKD